MISDRLRNFFMTSQFVTFLIWIKFNYSRDDLIGHITTPLQTNSVYRASDMAGVQCHFGSVVIHKYNWIYFNHVSAWFRLILYGYIIIRLLYKYNISWLHSCLGSALPRKLGNASETMHDLGHKMLYLYNNLWISGEYSTYGKIRVIKSKIICPNKGN